MNNYIQRLIDGDDSAMDEIYRSFRGGFISFAHSSLGLQYDDTLDLFQDAVICLLKNVRSGNLTGIDNRQILPYLCTTGRYIRNNRNRKTHLPIVPVVWDGKAGEFNIGENLPDTEDDQQEKEMLMEMTLNVVRSIPAPCSTLLELQFFHRKKQAEIAVAMGYESADSVKTMVNRCKGKVRTLVKQRYKDLGYE